MINSWQKFFLFAHIREYFSRKFKQRTMKTAFFTTSKSLILLLAILCIQAGQSQTRFRQYEITTLFTQGYDVCAGNINQDGLTDVAAVGCANGGEVSWWKNTGNVTFAKYIVRTGLTGARSVRITDLNNDNNPDLVVAAWEANDILWWENDGNQNWTEHVIDTNFVGAHTVDIKDMDEDGLKDVLCSGFDFYGHNGEIAWWKNEGDGNFTKYLISDRFQQSPFIYGEDMDGDGDLDVIACCELNDEVFWWENDGIENFTEYAVDTAFDAAHTVLARDADDDGDMDILGAACMGSRVAWWENQGYNNFVKHDLGAFAGALWLDAADFDKDGKTDLVGGAQASPQLAIWYGQGGGQFNKQFIPSNFSSTFAVLPYDFDFDTDQDLVAIGYSSNKISWFMNQTINPDFIDAPESVAFDFEHQRYLISSCHYNAIVAMGKTTHEQEIFIENINEPLGNWILNGLLYTSTGNFLKGYDLETREEVFSVNIVCLQHLDGITSDDNGFLYVVDTGGKIHKVNPETGETTCIVSSGLTQWVQDCVYDKFNNRLLSVGYVNNAPIQAIDLTTYEVTTATETPFGKYDGITIDQFGNVYLASHYSPGKIIKYLADFSAYEVISSGHSEPAGLDYNQFDNVLAVPNFSGDKVDFIPITVTGYEGKGLLDSPLKIFPNPNEGKFSIKIEIILNEIVQFNIVNSMGMKVYSGKVQANNTSHISNYFDFSDLPQGLYFLKFEDSHFPSTEKIIIR